MRYKILQSEPRSQEKPNPWLAWAAVMPLCAQSRQKQWRQLIVLNCEMKAILIYSYTQ